MCTRTNTNRNINSFNQFYSHFNNDLSNLNFRMDAIPSAHLRQQKLEHQRQLIEQKQKQKRQSVRIGYQTILQNESYQNNT